MVFFVCLFFLLSLSSLLAWTLCAIKNCFLGNLRRLKSLRLGGAYLCHWAWSLLSQVMACRLLGGKLLHVLETMLTYFRLDPWKQTSMKSWYKLKTISLKKIKISSAKWWPFCLGLNVCMLMYVSSLSYTINETYHTVLVQGRCGNYVARIDRTEIWQASRDTRPMFKQNVNRSVQFRFNAGTWYVYNFGNIHQRSHWLTSKITGSLLPKQKLQRRWIWVKDA